MVHRLRVVCVIVVLALVSNAYAHTIGGISAPELHGTGRDPAEGEVYNGATAFAGTDAETAWMVTAIIFIVLFALSIIVCIYLWYLRNAKMKELRHLQNIRMGAGQKDNQNVWYGGGAHI